MSRTYAAIAPSSIPESAAILERALVTCPPVGSGTGKSSRSHRPSIADGSMCLRPDQSSDASQHTAPARRTSAPSDGKPRTARARRSISRSRRPCTSLALMRRRWASGKSRWARASASAPSAIPPASADSDETTPRGPVGGPDPRRVVLVEHGVEHPPGGGPLRARRARVDHVPLEADDAALPGRAREELPHRPGDAAVGVGGHALHAGEPALVDVQ